MAFFSLFIMYIIAAVCICGFLFTLGGTITVISILRRRKAKRNGRKPKKFGLIFGGTLMAIPVAIVIYVVGAAVFSGVKLHIERKGYENFTDKWKNEHVTDYQARGDIEKEFFAAVDNNDAAAVAAMFTGKIQENPDFMDQVEKFLKVCPDDLSKQNIQFQGGGETSKINFGKVVQSFSADAVFDYDDTRYYIYIHACHGDDYEPENVGLEYFSLKSEATHVLEDQNGYRRKNNEFIIAEIKTVADCETRIVHDYSYMFYPHPERNITETNFRKTMQSCKNISNLESTLGEPNAICERLSRAVYELEPVDGKPRYAVVTYDDTYGKIYNYELCGTTWQDDTEYIDIE